MAHIRSLTHICPPTLLGGASVKIGKTEYKFDNEAEMYSFALRNDISIIRHELETVVSKCKYYRGLEAARVHNATINDCVASLIHFTTLSNNLSEIIESLHSEAAHAIDQLQKIVSNDTMEYLNQAKALVTLFAIKYKQN